uniref:ribonuclease domain-containing protein n=1 Tax=Streptomyces capillispiralis TaxID=68182 RepID=UPI0035710E51
MLRRALSLRLLACLLVLFVLPAGCSTAGDGGAAPPWAEGMATVRETALPAEARRTLDLIDAGGPFPYERDGAVFGNFEGLLPQRPRGHYREYTVPTPGSPDRGARRIVTGRDFEGLLPQRPRGHYREYTVPTPGSPDRGARRIVTGRDGETYYTDDHYASFTAVLR